MGKLIYEMNVSLDGFVETPDHSLEWATVDEELHFWFNEQARGFDASIYGRRMYELMADFWPTAADDPAAPPAVVEYAGIWRPMPKIVFSRSLQSVDWNSRLVRGDVAPEYAALRDEFGGDMDVGGATLAASFIRAGLVDEFRLLVHPVVLGAGTPFWPDLEPALRLRLIDTREFDSGVVYLGYERA
jgi:dihydrofolate reductase